MTTHSLHGLALFLPLRVIHFSESSHGSVADLFGGDGAESLGLDEVLLLLVFAVLLGLLAALQVLLGAVVQVFVVLRVIDIKYAAEQFGRGTQHQLVREEFVVLDTELDVSELFLID